MAWRGGLVTPLLDRQATPMVKPAGAQADRSSQQKKEDAEDQGFRTPRVGERGDGLRRPS